MHLRSRITGYLVCALLVAWNAHAADPFYERLLLEGTDAYHRGEFPLAIKYLRIANFGFLEEPPLLAQGLTLLALSEAGANDEESFGESFLRLAMIEERFQAYSQAKIPPEIRDDFERLAGKLIPRWTLESSPGFAQLASREVEARLESLSGIAKRRELERLIAQYPEESRWRLVLAQFELDEGLRDEAIRNATVVLESQPGNTEALLIRGLALATDEQWQSAAEDLAASGKAGEGPRQAEALLRSYVELQWWSEASIFLASLSDEIRNGRLVQDLVRLVEQNEN